MFFRFFPSLDQVGLWFVVCTEEIDVRLWIFVANGFIRKEAQRLMFLYGPANLLINIWLDHLRAPITMVGTDEISDTDIMQ